MNDPRYERPSQPNAHGRIQGRNGHAGARPLPPAGTAPSSPSRAAAASGNGPGHGRYPGNGHASPARALAGNAFAAAGIAPRNGWGSLNGATPPGLRPGRLRAAGGDRSRRARALRRHHLERAFTRRGPGAALLLRVLLVLVLLVLAFSLVSVGTVAAGAYYAYQRFTENLPDPDKLIDRVATFKTSYIYDRHGKLLYELNNPDAGRRTIVPYDQLSHYIIWATVATEDANFFNHEGVDPRAIARALYQNYTSQRVTSGASTIAQQLVRNVLFDVDERFSQSYDRKVREAILAYRITQAYSKEQILQMYLNEVSYGNLQYGVEAASQFYFGKSARDLNLAEAATLAGIPAAPNDYNPLSDPARSKARRNEVLDLMEKAGYFEGGAIEQVQIPLAEVEEARSVDLKIVPPDDFIQAPHWVWYVRDVLERRFGREWVYRCGCDIYTTLDLDFQTIASDEANAHLDKIRSLNANNAAVVAIDPHTGEILAMVGSANYYDPRIDGQVNVAISDRQPGSTLKPFTYLTAMERLGLTAATVIDDTPISVSMGQGLPPWRPRNHDGQFHGRVTVRSALARSLNIPPVKVLQGIGVPALLDTLHRAGVTSLTDASRYGLAVTLGGGEVKLLDLTFAYATLANNGVQIGAPVPDSERKEGMREYEPVAIKKIVRREDSKVEYEYRPPAGKQVLSPEAAYSITMILTDDRARSPTYGSNSFLKLSRTAAAKTGTTDDYRDGWTMGYTPDLVVGVWVGNTNNQPMKSVYGVSGAGYIWHNVMEAAFKHFKLPPREFERPEGLVMVPVDFATGRRPGSGPGAVEEWFPRGREPAMWANPRLFPDDFKREIAAASASPSPTAAATGPTPPAAPGPTAPVAPTPTPLPPVAPPPGGTGAATPPAQLPGGFTRPVVQITSPKTGAALRGQVTIEGTATMPNMRYYKVEFTSRTMPGWHPVSGLRQGPVIDAPLDVWNTLGLPPGNYQLMVTAVDVSGNWQQSAPVTVTIGS